MSKATALALAILPAEAFNLLASEARGGELLGALAVRTGAVVAFFLALALCWECRLVRMADLPWGRIRNLRRLQSLGAPVTAVVVAVATAVATAVAGLAVAFLKPEGPGNEGRDPTSQSDATNPAEQRRGVDVSPSPAPSRK